jgi:hypothetical protein
MVPWLVNNKMEIYEGELVAGFRPRRAGFVPSSFYMTFVVDRVALGQVFSEFFGFS